MPKKSGIYLILGGAVLMLSALLLFLYNDREQQRASREAESVMEDLQKVIREQQTAEPDTSAEEELPEQEREAVAEAAAEATAEAEPAAMINGQEYIGYLSIPDLGLELPVISQWDYEKLKLAPCRHAGSAETDDLVIAGHNYKTHFGPITRLEIGARVCFTDMTGRENVYVLEQLSILQPDAADMVLESDHDLVLYTCTLGGATRVVAFCDREENVGREGDGDE